MKIKRPKQYVVRCKQCGTIHHGKKKEDCPYCFAIGEGERILINALPTGELLKLDDDITIMDSI